MTDAPDTVNRDTVNGDIVDREMAVTVHERRTAYSGYLDLTVTDVTFHDPAGPVRASREVLHVGPVAVVLPYDPLRDEIVLLRQFRYAASLSGPGEMIELVAGLVDDGETPLQAAHRELKEEVSLEATDMVPLLDTAPSAGFVDEPVSHFVARVSSERLIERGGLAAEQEVIRPFAVPATSAIDAAFENRFRNGHALVALMAFSRQRERLRTLWR